MLYREVKGGVQVQRMKAPDRDCFRQVPRLVSTDASTLTAYEVERTDPLNRESYESECRKALV